MENNCIHLETVIDDPEIAFCYKGDINNCEHCKHKKLGENVPRWKKGENNLLISLDMTTVVDRDGDIVAWRG